MPPSGDRGDEPAAPLNRKALLSVLLGSAGFGFALLAPFLGFVLALPAVTCGVWSRREIADSGGTEAGDMVAVIGLTMGATTLGLLGLSWVLS